MKTWKGPPHQVGPQAEVGEAFGEIRRAVDPRSDSAALHASEASTRCQRRFGLLLIDRFRRSLPDPFDGHAADRQLPPAEAEIAALARPANRA